MGNRLRTAEQFNSGPVGPDAPVVHGERLLDALGRGLPVLQGRCDRERERVLLARVYGHGIERPGLPLSPVPTPSLEATELGVLSPRPAGWRGVSSAAPRGQG